MNPQEKRRLQNIQVRANKFKSEKNERGWKVAIAISSILFIVAIVWIEIRTHSITECQEKLFLKLTGEDAPKGVYDE